MKYMTKGGTLLPQIMIRSIVLSIAFMFASLTMGFAFLFFALGFFQYVQWFFPYSQPAYSMAIWILNLKHMPPKLLKPDIPLHRYLLLIIKGVMVIAFFYLGIYILLTQGFCNQNLICWAIKK